MRAVLVIIVLAALGVGGWFLWQRLWGGEAAPAIPPVLLPPAIPAPTVGAGEPPAAAQAALAEGDRLWAAAGADPVRSADATRILLAYSRALRALDGQPGQQPRIDALVRDRLAPLGQAAFFAKVPAAQDPTGTFAAYAVVAGDSPDRIGRTHGMSRELVNRLRGHAPDSAALMVGERVAVLRVKDQTEPDRIGYHLRIDKSDFRMDLYVLGLFAKRYRITHGAAASPTPLGRTTVTAREWHPQWTHPVTKAVLPYGHPENILGPVWLAFAADGIGKQGIGIHGYTGPDAEIGVMASNGCIRLANDDAEELYRTLPAPQRATTSVEIVD